MHLGGEQYFKSVACNLEFNMLTISQLHLRVIYIVVCYMAELGWDEKENSDWFPLQYWPLK